MIIIVTGTNTDVGKTIATAALACQYRDAGYGVEVVKPAQTGDDSDIRDIEKLSGVAGRDYTPPQSGSDISTQMTRLCLSKVPEVSLFVWLIPGPSRTWPLNSRHPSSW